MIKVDIVSGFLGAGKTTLIKRLLMEYENQKVVLIENEFGEIGIDGDLIEREGFEVYEISNGCICCIMQKDFVNLVSRVIKEFKPEIIVIEPTGLSILSEVIDALTRPEFLGVLSINSLITVIDSLNYLMQCDMFGEFFEDQIINARTLVLSKTQLVPEAKLQEITSSLRRLNKDADIINCTFEALHLKDINSLDPKNVHENYKDLFHAEYKPCRENEFDTFALETRKKITRPELEAILRRLSDPVYGTILRGKGFLKGDKGMIEFSYTNGQFNITESNFRSSGKLCLIGKNINVSELKKLFNVLDGGIFNWLKF